MSDNKEDKMIDFNIGWNVGEQQARQQQVNSPMRIETTTATSRQVTMSNQKQKTIHNLYKKNHTTPTILTQRTAPSAVAVRDHVNGKENPVSTVVSKSN